MPRLRAGRARDLAADLAEVEGRGGQSWQLWVLDNVDAGGWGAAIRRALHAEAEFERLRCWREAVSSKRKEG